MTVCRQGLCCPSRMCTRASDRSKEELRVVNAVLGCLVMIVMLGLFGMNPVLFSIVFAVLIIWALCESGSSGGSYSGSSGGYSSHSSYGGSVGDRRHQERREENWARSNERRRQQQADFKAYRSSMNNVTKRAADSGVNLAGSRNRSGSRSGSSSRNARRSGFGGGKSRGGGGGRSF